MIALALPPDAAISHHATWVGWLTTPGTYATCWVFVVPVGGYWSAMMIGTPLDLAESSAFCTIPYGMASRTMPAAPAPWAWLTHAAIAVGLPWPSHSWNFSPALASATFMVAAVTTKPGM